MQLYLFCSLLPGQALPAAPKVPPQIDEGKSDLELFKVLHVPKWVGERSLVRRQC